MAQYTARFQCGHTEIVRLLGKETSRQSHLKRLREIPCRDCRHADERDRALAYAEHEGLPHLIGSEKQIAWANVIRHKSLLLIARVLAEHNVPATTQVDIPASLKFGPDELNPTVGALVAKLRNQDNAKWWIDRAKDVMTVDKEMHIGRGQMTGLGMLTSDVFVAELLRAAAGIGRPTITDLAGSGDYHQMARALFRGR